MKKEIETKYSLKNFAKLRTLVEEMYQDVSCPWSEYSSTNQKLLIKNPNLNVVSERPMDYNYENKKIFKELFKIYDKSNFFVVKHIDLNPDIEEINGNIISLLKNLFLSLSLSFYFSYLIIFILFL
jgi:hypothetical protein